MSLKFKINQRTDQRKPAFSPRDLPGWVEELIGYVAGGLWITIVLVAIAYMSGV